MTYQTILYETDGTIAELTRPLVMELAPDAQGGFE
jgi:hypothetical protein